MGAGIRRVYLLTILRFLSRHTSHYICGNSERRIRAKKHLAANTITTATLFFCSVSPLRGIGLGLTYDNHWRQTETPMIPQKMSQVTSLLAWFPPPPFSLYLPCVRLFTSQHVSLSAYSVVGSSATKFLLGYLELVKYNIHIIICQISILNPWNAIRNKTQKVLTC